MAGKRKNRGGNAGANEKSEKKGSRSSPSSTASGSLIFCPNELDAVEKVASFFGLTPELSELDVNLAKSLKVDDPGIIVTFRDGESIRTSLQRGLQGRPCAPGANGPMALQNLKDWLTNLVPNVKQRFILHSGDCGMAIANLTQDEFNDLQNALSFTAHIPPRPWLMSMLVGGDSLGGVLAVTGTGIGQATMSKSPSNIFSN